MKHVALIASVLLLVLAAGLAAPSIRAQDGDTQATIAALQTQVAALSTRVAQLTTPTSGVATTASAAAGVVTEPRAVQGISAVELQTVGTLTIRQGTSERLTVTAEPAVLSRITTEVAGGVLTIGARGAFSTNLPIRYDLTIKDVQRIANSGSGQIEGGPLRLQQLQLSGSGSGEIQLNGLTVPKLHVVLSGSGPCTLSGTVTQQDVELSGAGPYDGTDLASQTATIMANGAGPVTVRVSDSLDVQLRGSGDVSYIGTPRLTQERTGSGRIMKIG